MISCDLWPYEQIKCKCIFLVRQPKNFILSYLDYFSKNFLKIERVYVRVMTLLQTKFYSIPVVIENITASAHITYYAHITPSYPI